MAESDLTRKPPACMMCGHCCGPYFALYVDEADEQRWEREGRRDILSRLDWERWHVTCDDDGAYHIDTGERFTRCAFLTHGPDGHSLCAIHDTKPIICRDYPPASSELCALHGKA
ncbi:MAG TPA: YkgJ family cysteine cluster protein [bacterium]|nr:YkgJ family cysteine cluster protein [bacterium]